MSSRITSLGLLTGSTATNNAYIWAIWNSKDYKIPVADLGQYIGRAPGFASAQWSVNYGTNQGTIFSWGDTPTYDTFGWYNSNSSNQKVYFFDDRVSEVNVSYQINAYGTGQFQCGLYKNGSLWVSSSTIGDSRIEGRNDLGYPVAFQGHAHRVPVSSGDYLDIRHVQPAAVRTPETGTSRCWWQVQPVVYR